MNRRDVVARDNPLLVTLRKLVHTPGAYRKLGQIWVEGAHLCDAALARGVRPPLAVGTEAALADPDLARLLGAAEQTVIVPTPLFSAVSGLSSPAQLGFVLALPPVQAIQPNVATVVLDGVQDAGNVGSVLRSASAMNVKQILAVKGTASLWSPKVLRAGMGAHFNLALHEGLSGEDLQALRVPLIATSSHAACEVSGADLPWPCGWLFGHEGQGVSPELLARCATTVRIPQPGGEESLNVAAAAAICLYEALRQRKTDPVQ